MSVIEEAKEPEQTINMSLEQKNLNIFYPGQKLRRRITKGEKKGMFEDV